MSSTTRRPNEPSVCGVFLLMMQSMKWSPARRSASVPSSFGAHHVAGAIADAHFLDLLRVFGEADALVVDLDLLGRLEIVVGDHLLAAAEQDLAHLDRRQPAHVDVRDGARIVEERDVREILGRAREMVDAARRDRDRMLAEQVVEDREVVHGEIGDHVHVALEQAEVHADRVVVVDASEVAALDDVAHLAHRAGVDKGVVDEQREIALVPLRRPACAPAARFRSSASRATGVCRP